MTKKTLAIIGAVLAITVAAVAGGAALLGGKMDMYRAILIYQLNGEAAITRGRVGEIAAYENLMLMAGDVVAVAENSNMRLKVDDDKYLLAEQNTVMNIKAKGSGDNSKTYIELQQGSVTNEIQNKLGPNAVYEVNTPNSIMAVRGTIFRVALEKTDSGDYDTKVSVFDGKVTLKPTLPDGTPAEKEVAIEAGKELIVDSVQASSGELSEPVEIKYEELPPAMQEYLIELVEEKGQALPENVVQSIHEAQSGSWSQEGTSQQENKGSDNGNGQNGQQDAEVKPNENAVKEDAPLDAEMEKKQEEANEKPKEDKKKEPEQAQPVKIEENVQEIKAPEVKAPEPVKAPEQEKKPQQQPQQQQPQQDQNNGGNNSGETENKPSGGEVQVKNYTVTFQCDGKVFGKQTVKGGEKAVMPKLSPTPNGSWNYDFSKKVDKDITVNWVAH